MSKKTLILIGVSIVIAFCIVMIINVYDMNRLSDPKPTPAATTAPKEKKSMAPVAAKMFDNSLKQAFGNNYETNLDVENGIFHVDTWFDQFDAAYIETMKTEGKELDTWNQIVDRVKYITASMQSTFDEVCEDENITVVTSICDPQHHDISYLTVANGVAGYDVVNGVDLLNK